MRAKKTTVAGKDIVLTLDLNAIINFCENYGIDFSEWESALKSPAKIRYFIWCMAISGGSDVTEEEVGKMNVQEMTKILEGISEKEEKEAKKK